MFGFMVEREEWVVGKGGEVYLRRGVVEIWESDVGICFLYS